MPASPCRQRDYWVKESIRDHKFEDVYTLQQVLGHGANSHVLRCRHIGTGLHWAVKIINKNADKKVACSEISCFLTLDCPNVVRLKEVYESRTQIFLVLELVSKDDIFGRLAVQKRYTEIDAARALRHILYGLQYLHQKGIVHRAIKPENLLCENEEEGCELKIADFWISGIIEPEVAVSTVCGTPSYTAPEVLRGVAEYMPSVDVWSVGVIAYILLCGYEPFRADNEAAVFRRIIKGQVNFDGEAWEPISEHAKDFVQTLLVMEPAKRPSAAAAFKHPWLRAVVTHDDHLQLTLDNMRRFNNRRRYKEIIRDTLADSIHANNLSAAVLWCQSV